MQYETKISAFDGILASLVLVKGLCNCIKMTKIASIGINNFFG